LRPLWKAWRQVADNSLKAKVKAETKVEVWNAWRQIADNSLRAKVEAESEVEFGKAGRFSKERCFLTSLNSYGQESL